MRQKEILVASLEVVDSTRGILSWGTAAIHSQCVALLWDSREDADITVMTTVAHDAGGTIVAEASITLPSGDTVLGTFVRSEDNLDEFVRVLRTHYVSSTGPDPSMLENPF